MQLFQQAPIACNPAKTSSKRFMIACLEYKSAFFMLDNFW